MKKMMIVFVISVLMFNYIIADQFVARIHRPTRKMLYEFIELDYYIASYKPEVYLDLLVDDNLYQQLLLRGFDLEITQTESQMKENMVAGRDLEGYRKYEDLLAELQQLEIDHPNLCKLYDIGESWGKQYSDAGNSNYDDYYHEIWALKLSDNVAVEEDEPGVFYLGTHHANEPISLEVTMAILYHLLDNYGIDPVLTENVNNTQIWFVPLINPNAHKLVTDEDYIFWRKNIRDNDENGDITPAVSYYVCQDGVDPNRNYGFEWGYVAASSENWQRNYSGPHAWSEPEVCAVKDFIDSHHFVAGITYHSYGEYVFWPYSYSYDLLTPDEDALTELGVGMASLNGYAAYSADDLYPLMGCTEDYAYGVHGVFCYTIEVASQFIPPHTQIQNVCNENIGPALLLLDRVNHSSLTGHITDASNGDPIVAEISVEGIDDVGDFRYPYTSNEEFGTYYRLLTLGSYNVTFSAYGYIPQTIDNVMITSTEPTVIDISLQPQTTTLDITGVVVNAETGSTIENAVVEILGHNIDPATTNNTGEYIINDVYPYEFDFKVYAEDYFIHKEEIEINNNDPVNFLIYQTDSEGFENGVFDPVWELSGNIDWEIDETEVYSGNYSAVNGDCWNDDYAVLSTTCYFSEPSSISFYRKISSESDDFLRFQIDDILMGSWSGQQDWESFSYPVSAGIHTFKWSYIKDGSLSQWSDCAWLDEITFQGTLVEELQITKSGISLSNYPNPFNPSTKIRFQISNFSEIEKAEIAIYNLKGQKVKSFDSAQDDNNGFYSVIWNGRDDNNKPVSSGIYFYKLKTENYDKTKRMILLK